MIDARNSDGPGPENQSHHHHSNTHTKNNVCPRQRPPVPRRLFSLAWEGRPGPLIAAGRTTNKYYADQHRQRNELPVAA